ncbi:hypothetical protein [Paraferrimonas sp. SM1919]|uniref:hypothetical protein n=1 Tax=Paraferrimonas sp. SM1919 TaxID=2662263 RepID=UPI0013D36441|nr:hypothetical protein [Paraferrimonas sp. SM1919]
MNTITKRELTKGLWSIIIEDPIENQFELRKRFTQDGYQILSNIVDDNGNVIFLANYQGELQQQYSVIELSSNKMAMLFDLETALQYDARQMLEEQGYQVLSATLDEQSQQMVLIAQVKQLKPLVSLA